MADSEKKISKLKRRFSKKPAKENGEDSGSSKFFSKKTSHAKDLTVSDELSNCGGKSATLPEGMSLHHPHSEGLFSKLKRRFHFSSKGKYDFKSFISSPTKPHWMRRKSDDTQLRHPESPTESTSDSGAVVTKSQSVKTQRKAKSDKEEVILIRKDQRVSVLCKRENGGKPEIIFTNEDVSDEDSSGIWGRIEEDPYATISSVHEEIIQKTKTNSKENSVIDLSPSISPEPLPANGHNVPVLSDDHYPYARINPDRNRSPESQNMYPQAKLFNLRASAYIKCRKEPDYETLDEIKEQKRALNSLIEAEDLAAVVNGSEVEETEAAMPELDPDYETLDEVKERCAKLSTASPPPVGTGSDASRCSKTDVKSPTDATSLVFDSTDVQQNVGFDTRKSPILQTHAVSSPESTSTHDRFPEPFIEDCIYDNPNVIIRKHKTDAVFNSRRGQTMYEPPLIKTPAEEELVEKLSSLLAPPLPLRNYQKDEVKGEKSKSELYSARHSWASQTSRALELIDNHYLRDSKRISPFSSNHEIGNGWHKDFSAKKTGAKRIEGNDSKMASSPTNKSPNSVVEVIGSVESVVKHGNTMTSSSSDSLDTQISQSLPENGLEHTHPVDHYEDACQLDFCVNLARQIVKDACERAVNQVQEQLNALSHDPHKICSLGNQLNSCAGALGEHLQNSEPNQVLQIKVDNKLTGENCDFENGGKALTSTLDCILTDASNNKENLAPTSLDRIIKSETPVLHESSNGRLEPVIRNGEDSGPIAFNEEKSEDKTEMYKLQGARPKFKPLILPSQTIYLKDQRFCPSVTKDTFVNTAGQGERRNLKEQLSDDSHTWDEAMSPSFSDLNFHEAITESLQLEPKNVPASTVKSSVLISESDQGAANSDNDFHAQETVYLDSDSETEEGLSVHNSLVVHVKRDLRVTRVAKPILYANPRFLENTISGPFTSGQSLDVNYLAYGVFKWGRYFHDFVHDREQVEGKLKSFFHFIRHMLMSESDLNAMNPQVKDLQEKFDSMQARIEKRFHFIKDLPTFPDVRIQLLKTEELDNWVPEFSQHFNQSRKLSYTRKNKEVNGRLVCAPQVPPKEDEVIRDDLHSDECMVAGADGTCPLGCIHSPCLSPTKPQDVLEDLLSLSGGMLTCASCGKEEESDSEDEMIVLETYARTVCCAPSKSSDSRVNYTKNAVYCRTLYGELAYTAKIRKPRSLSKSILVPGCSEECCGVDSHVSWNNWCSMDAIFKKLIPHISPRLDFQYLLKTYAEFKFFILKDRNRNLEVKGCFTKTYYPDGEEKCCRFEEFVFLKLLRDELQYFAHVLRTSKSSEALFLEEREVNFSLLSLLKIVLRNIHKMKNSLAREKVVGQGRGEDLQTFPGMKRWKHFRHSAFSRWVSVPLSEAEVTYEVKSFHAQNMTSFHCQALSKTLKDWKSPQEYMQDPNVLLSCRSVFENSDVRSVDFTNLRGAEDPKPLHEREDFLESMEQLQMQPWYWGPISYEQAALILKDKEDGSFLVRDSSDQKYLLSLSFKSLGEVHHTRIEHAKGLFSFWSQPESHGKARICEFIEKSIQNSRDGRFLYFLRPSARGTPPLPIRLLSPVSRNFRVATLKHLARFVVRQTVRNDHLDCLPVPEKVKRYLKNKQYYVEILDEDQWAFDGDYVRT